MKKASVSVFLGLSLALVMSLFFSMTEVVRFAALKEEGKNMAGLSCLSAFGEYNRPLWDDYKILALDTSYGLDTQSTKLLQQTILSYVEEASATDGAGVDFLQMEVEECEISDTVYLTDGEGAAFIKEGAKCLAAELTEDVVQSLLEECSSCESASKKEVDLDEVLSNTQKNLDNTTAENTESEESTADAGEENSDIGEKDGEGDSTEVETSGGETSESKNTSKDIIATITDLKTKGVLAQVVSEEKELSEASFSTEAFLSNRELNSGTKSPGQVTLPERALFQYYLTKHFSSYEEVLHEDGMKYELEYILCGKNTDRENLAATVERLLFIREVENLIALNSDKARVAEAKSIAAAATAVLMHPELEEVVSYGLLVAWAYMESVLDVRLLLEGGKVPFIKTSQEWTSNLSELPTYLDVNVKAKDCERGLSYKQYLFGLFTLESQKNISYRAMDLVEEALHQKDHYDHVSLDLFLVEANIKMTLCSHPMFLVFIPLYQKDISLYEFCYEKKMTYL